MQSQPKSLVLVTVDCLRRDHCGFYGYPLPTTPFLDTLAADSLVVPTAVVAGAPTYYSFPAILASRMPLALGRDVVGLAPGEDTLATALRQAGYATGAFSAANPYLSPRFGYDRGFEVFEDFLGCDSSTPQAVDPPASSFGARGKVNRTLKTAAHTVGLGRLYDDLYFQYCVRIAVPSVHSIDALRRFPSAELVVDRAISWLTSTAQRPFFLWLHLMDPHSPYCPSAAAFHEFAGRDVSAFEARYLNEFWNRSNLKTARLQKKKDKIVELYDAGIRSVDREIARLVAHLQRSHLWDNCTFALTADHGEEFLDHGSRYHAPLSLADEIACVPLLIRVPASESKNVPHTPFSHLHLAPTLLATLDVPSPKSFQGRSLWHHLQHETAWDDPALTECVYGCTNPLGVQDRIGARLLSVRNSRHKLVMRMEPGVGDELYDLEADPREEQPLAPGTEKEARWALLRSAQKHLQETSGRGDATARLKARLRDLRVELESTVS